MAVSAAARVRGVGVVVMLAAAGLSVVSISGTGDTPCGSILEPNFGWETYTQCGLVHVGTAVMCALLGIVGLALLLIARAARGGGGAVAATVVGCASVAGAIATAVLTWRTSTWDEPVLRRGWTSLRDVAATLTLALSLVTAFLAIDARAGSQRRDDVSSR